MLYKYMIGAIAWHNSQLCGTTHTGRSIRQCRDVISVGHWLSEAVHKYLVSATSTSPSPHLSIVSKMLRIYSMSVGFSFVKTQKTERMCWD